jgi:putative alpha-1,2-mannosidase
MMGFYPVNPCGDGYVLGEVQADEIRISVNNGKSFSILKRKDSNDSNVRLNGQKIDRVKISHEEIVRGGTLEFVVSD